MTNLLFNRRELISGFGTLGAAVLLPLSPSFGSIGKMQKQLDQNKVPGASISVISGGKISFAQGLGIRSNASSKRVTVDTRFQAASLSKTVNALALLSLERDGKISINKPVNQYLARWKLKGKGADTVTIMDLLSHAGGTNVHGFAGYPQSASLPNLLQILRGKSPANSNRIQKTLPRGQFKYSGGGITVLQALVEDVSDSSYQEVVNTQVLKPLGMRNSAMTTDRPGSNFAVAHLSSGQPLSGGYHRYPELAAAGLWTTPSDMSRMLLAIYESNKGQSGAFLPRSLTGAMLRPFVKQAAAGTFAVGENRIVHNGSNAGFKSFYLLNADLGSGYVVMSNGENGGALNKLLASSIRAKMGW